LNGLGIVAALAAETRALGRATTSSESPASLADGTLLVVSGMGQAAAGRAARRLVDAGARSLMSWGMAGGLDPTLAAGTLLLPREVASPEGALFLTAGDWRQRLRSAVPVAHPVCCGKLLTCRAALGSAAEKAIAFRQTAAVAVDMESIAIAEVAASRRLPFLVVRAIVDTAADEVPQALAAAAATGADRVSLGRLIGALARTPADILPVLRLARRFRAASRALAAAVASGALAPPLVPAPSGNGGP
jgi:adenosylhomocysteine nucleosidase